MSGGGRGGGIGHFREGNRARTASRVASVGHGRLVSPTERARLERARDLGRRFSAARSR